MGRYWVLIGCWVVFSYSGDTAELHHLFNLDLSWVMDAEDARDNPSSLTGIIRYHHRVYSHELNNRRTVVVYLPPGYYKDHRRYGVLYMHDGNNIFDRRTAFNGVEWQVDEAAEQLIRQKLIAPVIVVGIYNTPGRIAEYTHSQNASGEGGAADRYLSWIVNTLKPLIDHTYRTLRDRNHTAIAGSSLGGLVSLYAGIAFQETFSMVGAVSPSIWWNDRDILDRMASSCGAYRMRFWMDMGTEEGDRVPGSALRAGIRDLRDLRQIMVDIGCHDWIHVEVKGGRHNELSWQQRVPYLLYYLFGLSPAL